MSARLRPEVTTMSWKLARRAGVLGVAFAAMSLAGGAALLLLRELLR